MRLWTVKGSHWNKTCLSYEVVRCNVQPKFLKEKSFTSKLLSIGVDSVIITQVRSRKGAVSHIVNVLLSANQHCGKQVPYITWQMMAELLQYCFKDVY